jgi:hypothetical protein
MLSYDAQAPFWQNEAKEANDCGIWAAFGRKLIPIPQRFVSGSMTERGST